MYHCRKRLGVTKKSVRTTKRTQTVTSSSTEVPEHTKMLPLPCSPSDSYKQSAIIPAIAQSSHSSSFELGLDEEIMEYMDRMDCGVHSSTPVSIGRSHKSQSTKQLFESGAGTPPQLDFFTPVRTVGQSNSLYNKEATSGGLTPITTPGNNSRSISVLQTPLNKPDLSLSCWGLPEKVLESYSSKGINHMFSWQAECLSLSGVLEGQNVIYSAPTSAGKTLVAELLLLKCILERQKKVVVILPFVSIVHEKTNYLQSMFEHVGIKIGGFMGGHAPQGGLAAVDVAICTIEKANSLVNRLLEEGSIDQLGMVIVDELHMVGDHHRGYLLELLLTKLLYVCQNRVMRNEKMIEEGAQTRGVQLLGMSATLPNLPTLAKWLNAVLYQTDFRPVPLKEMVKIGNTLYDYNFKVIKKIDISALSTEEDEIAMICHEKMKNNHSVLIFCPTKAWCEKLAVMLMQTPYLQTDDVQLDTVGLDGVCEQLRRTQVGIDPILAKTLPFGIAFHHAGLTFDEREIIEGAFRQCSLRVLVATSTLSSGVNLPARLVIVRTPIFHRALIDILMYKQMVGRAGRKGVDEEGESILVCKPSEKSKVTSLLQCTPSPVKSCLGRPPQVMTMNSLPPVKGSELTALKRAVLEVIVNGTATLEPGIMQYLSCTLLYTELLETESHTEDISVRTNTLLKKTLEFLLEKDFIRERRSTEQHPQEYYCTQFGMATVASGLAPDDALIVFDEFQKARKAFVLENELHIIYLVTPVYILDQWSTIDWYKFFTIWERLSEDVLHVANVVGVQESFLARATQSKPPERTPAQQQRLRIHRRFFTSLALYDLVREVPLSHVVHRYGASKGLLQSLQSASGTFSGMVTVFCNKLGWTSLELLLSQFQSRLTFGIERELVDMVRISLLNGCRARVLFNGGYHTLSEIAAANPLAIESTLRNAFPYKTKQEANEERGEFVVNWCAKLRKGLTESEAAKEIVQDARKIICEELNIPESAWESNALKNKETVNVVKPAPSSGVRMSRKTNNKKGSSGPSSGHKRLKLATTKNCPPPSSIHVAKDPQSPTTDHQSKHHYTGFVLCSKLFPDPVENVDPNNCHTEINQSEKLCETSAKSMSEPNQSLDLFMDLSANTLAQLDVTCSGYKEAEGPNSGQLQSEIMHVVPSDQQDVRCDEQYFEESVAVAADQSFKNLSMLHSTTCSESGMAIIDVAANETLLETFLDECKEQNVIAFAVATETVHSNNGIGASFIKPCHSSNGLLVPMSNEQILGVAFSWGELDAYYLSLCESIDHTSKKRGLDTSQVGANPSVPLELRIKALRSLFAAPIPKYHVVAYDIKKHIKLLMSSCQVNVTCKMSDPKVADWLLDPDAREKTLNHLVIKYLPAQPTMADGVDGGEATLCNVSCHSPFPYLRSSAECVLAEMLMSNMNKLLQAEKTIDTFESVEMPIVLILAEIEINGIGFSTVACEGLRDQLQYHLSELEQEAYTHAGRIFSLTSPEDVSIVMFNELKLPTFQEASRSKSLGVRKEKRGRVQHLSTSKDILEKIRPFHPLPGVVLEWRRVSNTVTRTLFPLFKASVTHTNLDSNRIHPFCQIHTATGRVSILEPNLQNVPKEYPIGLHKVSSTTQQSLLNSLLPEFEICAASHHEEEEEEGIDQIKTVCMRDVFKPFPGGIFLTADYSQLELRLLAHLSKDVKLCSFLNQSGDAFRMIAGEWLSIEPADVTDTQRQQAKQMCYGMVYGIGAKALGEQMQVSEDKAFQFMESFKSKYPQVKKFITTTINQCRETGHIVTILSRKRFLPHINSTDVHKRAHAERQAVNSTIQGSAADMVKRAMINVERELHRTGTITCLSKLGPGGLNKTNVALLVLQLHDELLYEVNVNALDEVVRIVKKEMESALNLSVPFPVNIKVGKSWGCLEPINV